MFKKILVAYDGTDTSEVALRRAAELAGQGHAELHVLGVARLVITAAAGVEISQSLFDAEREMRESALRDAVAHLDERVSVHAAIREGNPPTQIAAHAREIGADLVVIGHSDKSLFARFFEGSTGAGLIRDLPCDLLVATGP